MKNYEITSKNCYLSTPKHLKSFIGRFLYIYTAKGNASLNSDFLTFKSKKKSFEIPTGNISHFQIGHYSRIAKPVRLDYLEITYDLNGIQERLLLTPTDSSLSPVWETNKTVKKWMDTLLEMKNSPKS